MAALESDGEYRGKANFHAGTSSTHLYDEYHASKSKWLFLAMAMPISALVVRQRRCRRGIGFSRNTISSFLDVNTPAGGVAFGGLKSKWNFAWALHAASAFRFPQARRSNSRSLRQLWRRDSGDSHYYPAPMPSTSDAVQGLPRMT